jgi:hypothetical protein
MTKPLFIARQSRHPHGLIGWVVARVMERERPLGAMGLQ